MSVSFRLPKITAPTETGKLLQLQDYMYGLVEQLNWALNNIDSISVQPAETRTTAASATQETGKDPVSNFNSIKGLIIKSADIISAYYQEINELLKLSGEYVAEATFPEGSAKFVENTTAAISVNSKAVEQFYTDMQTILSDIGTIKNSSILASANIKSGLLFYDEAGVPVFGLEIGQRNEVDGVEVFNKFAQFTSEKVSFFDSNGVETAYISDYKLNITHAEITGTLKHGGFKDIVLPDNSVVTKWLGGG